MRPDHIGDMLFATPALRILRQALPAAHLAAMIGPWGEAVLQKNPRLDELIICEFPGFARKPKGSVLAPYRQLRAWATQLRTQRFDLALVLRFDHWWGALLAYLAGIPHRVGYAISECQPFLTCAIPYISSRHEVLQNITLVQQAISLVAAAEVAATNHASLALEYTVSSEDQEYIADYLTRHGVAADQALVAIHPGAGAAVKQWRPEAWAEVADAVAERWRARVVITGSCNELDLAWAIYARMDAEPIISAGDTSLGQLAALFQRCRLVIGPDCGPLHLAVAVGTPTVHLYGPVDRHKFGPWGPADKHVVLTADRGCIPCNRLDYAAAELVKHPCVREITVEAVLKAASRLLMTDTGNAILI